MSGPRDDVRFGTGDAPDWREAELDDEDIDELPEGGFPEEVAAVLGFDPTEEEE